MSIRATLALVFAVAAAVVLLASGALYVTSDRLSLLQRRSELSYEQLTRHITLANHAGRYMREAAEISLGGGDTEELRYLTEVVARDLAAVEALERAWVEHPHLREEPGEARENDERLRKMRASLATIAGDVGEVSRMASGGERLAANRRFVERPEAEYERGFVPHIDAAIRDARRDVARNAAAAGRESARIRIAGVALMTAALVLLVALLGGLLRAMARGFGALAECSRRIAGGDLDDRVPDLGKHEFGRIGAALRHMAERLREAQESRLRVERLAAIGQLAASVGHELRNPLGAIRNAAYYLKKRLAGTELGADPRVAQFLDLMEKELLSCTRIIGDLLDFARERRLCRSACPLAPLVDDAMSVVEAPAHVRLVNQVPAALPVPSLDKDQFRQVLVNLIQNAAEAIPAGREGRVVASARVCDGALVLTVEDDGAGIEREHLAKIFEPLFSTKLKGTGLGLAITAGIVRMHGGAIAVESAPGAGTTFIIRLPLAAAPEVHSAQPA
ncbi:sensor histidine kinase [Sorangium cellulosum]|uniref:histidine kinase n=1 Tax=Sorangium cellulosum So0157-2 TaxID=1254432 RepID=S4YGI3_SORCE|nr:ATP-binding protein [Sorangium cellulosum]AGP41978.1 histidine kinase [Sorangium cellulosum So0157-2]